MLVLCGMATMLLSALRFRYGETPIYLHQTGRVAEARASLDDVVAANGTHVPPFKLAQPSVSGASGMYADAAQQLRHRSRSRGGETGQELTQTLTQHDQFGAAAGDGGVLAGGGQNHRMGLYDRAMVKDNHLVVEGGVAALRESALLMKKAHPGVKVEVEAEKGESEDEGEGEGEHAGTSA